VITQSSLSLQYVQAQVQATVLGTPYDPTSGVVQFAFTRPGAQPALWLAGAWGGTVQSGVFIAQCLVGPGGTIALTPARYNMWIKVTDSPEIPVINVGTLMIT
jgi:hypothetical protein